jgi:hypothetical protein
LELQDAFDLRFRHDYKTLMPSLRDLARINGKNLAQLGLHPVHARLINIGSRRAGPVAIARMAEALGVPTSQVAAACDAAWQAKQRPASPDAPAVDPSANGAQVVHAANSNDGVAP